jgi:predicted dienelactone hydrolase
MRIFEAILILLNLLSLFLIVKEQSRTVWFRLAGANLSVLLIHGLFEGMRYQMAFPYIFVGLLTVFTFLKGSRKFNAKMPKAVKVMAISLSFVFLMVTVFLAYALPVFTLSKPTGSYDVGIQYFHWIDENRTDPFLDASTKKRELMVKVYYPAEGSGSKPYSRYFHNSPELIRSFTTFYGLPAFMFDHFNLVRMNSKDGLPLSDQQQTYPVILFSHGAGTSMEVQTSQSEDLASHGYIVVAIDHTYVSAATAFPDRITSHKEATTNFQTADPAELITQIMTDDAAFVIQKLEEMNDGEMPPIFVGKLNLDAIGAIGHSVGGAVAYNLAINDSRVKAAINLDGRVYVTPNGDPEDIAPFLMLANDTFHMQAILDQKSLMKDFAEMTDEEQNSMLSIYGSRDAYQEAYSKDTENVLGLTDVLRASGNLFTIEGSDHMKFTDIGLFIGIRPLRELINIRGETDPGRCLEITKALTLAFFDQFLKGETSTSFESLINRYPELIQVHLK